MKEPFDVMSKVPLEEYFVSFMIPKLRNGNLKDSKKIDKYHSLREYLGLVLLSYFLSKLNDNRYAPAINNRNYDDGVIANINENTYFPVEQAYIYEDSWEDKVLEGIRDGLKKKIKKGSEYANNMWLLIFCNANGEFKPNTARDLLLKTKFQSVIFIGPSGNKEFEYYVYLAKDGGVILNELFKLTIDINGEAKLQKE